MPGSSPKGKLTVLDWRKELPNVKRILDVGPGWGTYSKLLRKPGEVWDAVEIFEPYIKKFKLHDHYDTVHNISISNFHPSHSYDLVILGDILEHIDLEESKRVLKNIFSFSKYCLLSLPLDDETGADLENAHDYWDNIHERHLSVWSNSYFINTVTELGGEIIALKKYQELGLYLVASTQEENFLSENITIFDKMKHKVISLDAGEAFKQKAKYYILKGTPKGLRKHWKKISQSQ